MTIDELKQMWVESIWPTINQGAPVFEGWLAFSGRRNRLSFLACTMVWAVMAGIFSLLGVNVLDFASISSVVVGIPLMFVYSVLMAQRLRDIGCPVHIGIGVFPILAILAVLSQTNSYAVLIVAAFAVLIFPGTRGDNNFGPNPLNHAQSLTSGAGVPVCEKWFTYSGRRNRLSFVCSSLLLLAATLLIFCYMRAINDIGAGTLLVIMIPFGFVFLVLAAQRLRDIGFPGWIVIIPAVLIGSVCSNSAISWWVIGIVFFFWLAMIFLLSFRQGTAGENRFGPDPLEESA